MRTKRKSLVPVVRYRPSSASWYSWLSSLSREARLELPRSHSLTWRGCQYFRIDPGNSVSHLVRASQNAPFLLYLFSAPTEGDIRSHEYTRYIIDTQYLCLLPETTLRNWHKVGWRVGGLGAPQRQWKQEFLDFLASCKNGAEHYRDWLLTFLAASRFQAQFASHWLGVNPVHGT